MTPYTPCSIGPAVWGSTAGLQQGLPARLVSSNIPKAATSSLAGCLAEAQREPAGQSQPKAASNLPGKSHAPAPASPPPGPWVHPPLLDVARDFYTEKREEGMVEIPGVHLPTEIQPV